MITIINLPGRKISTNTAKKLIKSLIEVISGKFPFSKREFGKKDHPFLTEIIPKINIGIKEHIRINNPVTNFLLDINKNEAIKTRNIPSYLIIGSIEASNIKQNIFFLPELASVRSSEIKKINNKDIQICKTCSRPVNIRGGRGVTITNETNTQKMYLALILDLFNIR